MVIDSLNGSHEASANFNRVGAVSHPVESSLGNRPSKDSSRGRSISGLFVGIVGHVLNQPGAHVLELVLQVNGLGDGDTILGDLGTAPARLNDHVAALENNPTWRRVTFGVT